MIVLLRILAVLWYFSISCSVMYASFTKCYEESSSKPYFIDQYNLMECDDLVFERKLCPHWKIDSLRYFLFLFSFNNHSITIHHLSDIQRLLELSIGLSLSSF